jgi:eukaryotic-like serine/threonine-protein kinase
MAGMSPRPPNPATDPTISAEASASTISSDGGIPPGPAGTALRPGVVVAESYQVTRLIGQGGMGAVWEAKHLRLPDKRVVVKVLLYGASDTVALARFRREAEIASRLGHPNIVQVLDFNTLPDGTPYIVLELLQGESLAARLHRTRLTFDQTTAIVGQIGSALAAAHREGIVHRDLKPDNIFLCPTDLGGEIRDVVKVLDFGISKIRNAKTVLTQDSALIGTPQYMAPEQATGRNDDIDARTDIFAFGAIVFEMLTGRPPFLGDTLASVIHAVVYAPAPRLHELAPDTPLPVAAAIERALAKNRDERFPDVGSFVKAVTARSIATAPTMAAAPAASLPTVPSVMPTAAPSAIATERVTRRRSMPLLGVLTGLAIAGAGSAYIVLSRPGPARTAMTDNQPVETKPVETKPVETKPVSAKPVETKPVAATIETRPQPTTSKSKTGDKNRDGQEALSPAAESDLAEAQAALDGGRSADAIRLAQHSLYAQKSSRAYAIMARARCAQGDLGNAKAALSKVAARDRPAVVRDCGKLDVDIR